MANPTTGWDPIPVYGFYQKFDGTPITGNVEFTFDQRVLLTNGRVIYPEGAKVLVTIGNQLQQDSVIRESIRAAWRAEDALLPGFNGTAWDVWWTDVMVPSGVFVGFPGLDDPNIAAMVDPSVTVRENLQSGEGKEFQIVPVMADLDLAIPGVNLGSIVVPVDSADVPVTYWAKDTPGGIAGLDEAGKLDIAVIPDGAGGNADWNTLLNKPAVIAAGATQGDARAAIGAGTSSLVLGTTAGTAAAGDDARLSDARAPLAHTQASTTITDFAEAVQDVVGAMLVSGGTITLNYNDTTGQVTITSTGADAEAVRDTIGAAIIGGNGVTVAINDALDTITIGLSSLAASLITSGTFDSARLPAATTTTQGAVELATNAEAITGTDADRAPSVAALNAAILDRVPTKIMGIINNGATPPSDGVWLVRMP